MKTQKDRSGYYITEKKVSYTKINSEYILIHLFIALAKSKMYRTILGKIDLRPQSAREPKIFDTLYKQAKEWGKPKAPKVMRTHINPWAGKLFSLKHSLQMITMSCTTLYPKAE